MLSILLVQALHIDTVCSAHVQSIHVYIPFSCGNPCTFLLCTALCLLSLQSLSLCCHFVSAQLAHISQPLVAPAADSSSKYHIRRSVRDWDKVYVCLCLRAGDVTDNKCIFQDAARLLQHCSSLLWRNTGTASLFSSQWNSLWSYTVKKVKWHCCLTPISSTVPRRWLHFLMKGERQVTIICYAKFV